MRTTELILLIAIFPPGIAAADEKPLDVTISVVTSPDELPAAVTKNLELPAAASDTGRDHAAAGLGTANQAREMGREFGQGIADDAKAHGHGGGKP